MCSNCWLSLFNPFLCTNISKIISCILTLKITLSTRNIIMTDTHVYTHRTQTQDPTFQYCHIYPFIPPSTGLLNTIPPAHQIRHSKLSSSSWELNSKLHSPTVPNTEYILTANCFNHIFIHPPFTWFLTIIRKADIASRVRTKITTCETLPRNRSYHVIRMNERKRNSK